LQYNYGMTENGHNINIRHNILEQYDL